MADADDDVRRPSPRITSDKLVHTARPDVGNRSPRCDTQTRTHRSAERSHRMAIRSVLGGWLVVTGKRPDVTHAQPRCAPTWHTCMRLPWCSSALGAWHASLTDRARLVQHPCGLRVRKRGWRVQKVTFKWSMSHVCRLPTKRSSAERIPCAGSGVGHCQAST